MYAEIARQCYLFSKNFNHNIDKSVRKIDNSVSYIWLETFIKIISNNNCSWYYISKIFCNFFCAIKIASKSVYAQTATAAKVCILLVARWKSLKIYKENSVFFSNFCRTTSIIHTSCCAIFVARSHRTHSVFLPFCCWSCYIKHI